MCVEVQVRIVFLEYNQSGLGTGIGHPQGRRPSSGTMAGTV